MKNFNHLGEKNFKKYPLDFEEHEEFAKDLRLCQQILEPWIQRFYHAYSVNGKEVTELKNVLVLLSSRICCTQDDHYYKLPTDHLHELDSNRGHNSPYYGKGKCAW